jgi:hypothetical protein
VTHDDSHLPSCPPDCRAGETDPALERALAQYDELLAGLSPEEEDRLLRRSWTDDDGSVHVRALRVVDGGGDSDDHVDRGLGRRDPAVRRPVAPRDG